MPVAQQGFLHGMGREGGCGLEKLKLNLTYLKIKIKLNKI